jgi:hypothetical protein
MAGQLHDTAPVTGAARRSDYGAVRLGRRDIDGLILCAEQHGAPYDLLAAALSAQPTRLRGIVARWRRAGFAATGRLESGPAWCRLTFLPPPQHPSPSAVAPSPGREAPTQPLPAVVDDFFGSGAAP